MTRPTLRTVFRALAVGVALFALVPGAIAFAQQLGAGMDRTGTVGIENETERKLFFGLICTCGCPRETLGTCTCGFAHQRRDELRQELAAGRPIAAITAAYAERFGPQALAVPPNEGASRALYLLPIGVIVAMAAGVVIVLRRWSARGAGARAAAATGAPGAPPKRDAYDDKLDEELRALDDE
jgi:cytochrome c-type biogenesis protein CcmH/NrfF